MLEAIVREPEQAVSELELLSSVEREQLLVEWNQTAREYPSERSVHELFEGQAERTPEAMAVVYEEQQLTYGELNRRANQLAHYLRALGVGPEVLVGVLMAMRSADAVVALGEATETRWAGPSQYKPSITLDKVRSHPRRTGRRTTSEGVRIVRASRGTNRTRAPTSLRRLEWRAGPKGGVAQASQLITSQPTRLDGLARSVSGVCDDDFGRRLHEGGVAIRAA